MTIKVENILTCYEIQGEKCDSFCVKLKVESHWNRDEFVVLQFEDGKKYTVIARELKAAIDNARNIVRF